MTAAPVSGDRVRYLLPLTGLAEDGAIVRVPMNSLGVYNGPLREDSLLPADYHDTTTEIDGVEYRCPAPLHLLEVHRPATEKERRRLHALLRERAGATGKARFPVLTGILGWDVTSTRQLTAGDVARVVDALLAREPAPGEAGS